MTNSKQKGSRGEVWKPVIGYEGHYEVSNLGRVKSLKRYRIDEDIILSQYHNKKNGYCYVSLCKDSRTTTHRVHKIVMQAFTDYRNDRYDRNNTIDHINGDKSDNRLDNLEVCSQRENQLRAYALGLEKLIGVEVIDLDTLAVFKTYKDAAKSVGGKQGTMVARVCNGDRSHYRNHHFARLKDYESGTIPKYKGKIKKKASESLWAK